MSHGFSERSLRDQQPLIMQYVNLFIQRLHENCVKDEPIDMMAWYNFITFDIIGDLAFGEPFGCLERSDYHPWIRTIFISARLGTVVQTANHYPWLKKLMLNLLSTKSARASRGKNLNNAKKKVQRRMDLGGKGGRPDLIEGLLKKKDELVSPPWPVVLCCKPLCINNVVCFDLLVHFRVSLSISSLQTATHLSLEDQRQQRLCCLA